MRVLVTGKGGVGKTTVSAALCAAMADEGLEVVAVDADSSPNLSVSLGAGDPEDLPAVANTKPRRRKGEDGEQDRLTSARVLTEFAVTTNDQRVRVVQTGRIERPSSRCLCCGSHATAREVLAALAGSDSQVVIADLEPGLNDMLWARPKPDDVVVVVTEASQKSIEVARRSLALATELGVARTLLVANKLRPDEVDHVRGQFPDVDMVEIAFDPALEAAVPNAQGPEGVREIATRLAANGTHGHPH